MTLTSAQISPESVAGTVREALGLHRRTTNGAGAKPERPFELDSFHLLEVGQNALFIILCPAEAG